jgi:hypothetical protein
MNTNPGDAWLLPKFPREPAKPAQWRLKTTFWPDVTPPAEPGVSQFPELIG